MQHQLLDTWQGGKICWSSDSCEPLVCPFLYVDLSYGYTFEDQVPVWWCLDLDSFMHWEEWLMPIWTAGKVGVNTFRQFSVCSCRFSMAPVGSIKCVSLLHRPVVVIGGSSDRNQETAGAFQEFPQVIKNSFFFHVDDSSWNWHSCQSVAC